MTDQLREAAQAVVDEWFHKDGAEQRTMKDAMQKLRAALDTAPPAVDELERRLRRIAQIIETADNRAMAADGPVGGTAENIDPSEWREIYILARLGDTR
jgi:hypothetical protein